MKIIDTYINLAINCSDLKNLSLSNSGTSRLIIETTATDTVVSSIVVIDFDERHTNHLINSTLDQQIIFIN